jgi:Protein of unknown function (DUF4238)
MGTIAVSAVKAKHHFVPQFYLKGFTDDDGALWAYVKGVNAPRKTTPRMECHRDNYYTVTYNGMSDDSVEKLFSVIESKAAPIVKSLLDPAFVLNKVHVEKLFTFVALMFVRVPAYRDFLNTQASAMAKRFGQAIAKNREEFLASARAYEAESGQSLGDLEKVRELAASDNYTLEQRSDGYNLKLTLRSFESVLEILRKEYSYDILYAPEGEFFIATDNPIVTLSPDLDGQAWVGMGFDRLDTEVLFPLNKRACLLLGRDRDRQHLVASATRHSQINGMMMGLAQHAIYAPSGTRRLARIFNERGCKIKYGENAFLSTPPKA